MLRIAGGTHRGRRLRSVRGDKTRPTSERVREALFSIAAPRRIERMLDCFAGTGAIALEALSRGASSAVAIEREPSAVAVIQANAEALGLASRLEIVRADVLVGLQELTRMPPFDLLVADPPYSYDRWDALLAGLASVAAPAALIAVEHAADQPLPVAEALQLLRDHRYGGTMLSLFEPAGSKSRTMSDR
ncbi:MAG: 16S rRNA (guanine(966)-N(2))-methyltransferase RsmD [Cyanobacteria bacterium REEB65]|nr:16S rRNA (guanine(966)-N(2))-methyltransferase RsmD [Cyanobacteria bacterium REEB65]